MGINPWLANREPWTVERTLHLGLAGIVVIGWTLVYTALMRGVDAPQDITRRESAGTKVSANLAAPQTPSNLSLSVPAPR